MRIVHARAGTPTEQRAATFTGVVFGDSVLPATEGVMVNTITFAPGARTHWHTHERGQLLTVVAGAGLVQLRGEPAQPIRTGDVVWISPGEDHWHGAAPDSLLVHTAVSLGETAWGDPVLDDDYLGRNA
jgi:quercetin dioxygenase-like cupin family protein